MMRPAEFCRGLLRSLDAAEGRRRRRRRDTTPDAIGLALKRNLLEGAAHADPEPADFEAWLAAHCAQAGSADGPLRALALDVLREWRLAAAVPALRDWLVQGARSDDAR